MSKFIPNSFQLPNAFVDDMLAQVGGNACKVYLLIVRKTRGWQKEKDYISYSQIQKITGISSATVSKAIDELSKLGLIKVKTGNEKSANQYSLNDSFCTLKNEVGIEKPTLKNEVATLENKAQGTLKTKDTENNLSKTTKDKTNDVCVLKISFDDFWNLYDKKVGDKEKIKTKWEKLKDSEREAIMNHLPLYKKSQPNKKYRKDPSTYLNNKSWNDEIIFDDGQQPVSHDYTEQAAAPVFDEVVLKTDPKVLAMIAAKRKGGSHGTA